MGQISINFIIYYSHYSNNKTSKISYIVDDTPPIYVLGGYTP